MDNNIINGKILAHGANPDLGSMENIHSHRYEAYVVLSAFLFIAEYSKNSSLQFNNQCILYYDNKDIVKKYRSLAQQHIISNHAIKCQNMRQ